MGRRNGWPLKQAAGHLREQMDGLTTSITIIGNGWIHSAMLILRNH